MCVFHHGMFHIVVAINGGMKMLVGCGCVLTLLYQHSMHLSPNLIKMVHRVSNISFRRKNVFIEQVLKNNWSQNPANAQTHLTLSTLFNIHCYFLRKRLLLLHLTIVHNQSEA